jgi:glycosyltransferase involved in cell wall biosynthesis
MKLSMVTICYNAEQVIEKTILSVLNQTKPVYEYVLIDGGSTDKSYEIIKSYEKSFTEKGIRYVHISEKDKGISDAFNKGVQRATGDLVGIINADDELLPNTCEILEACVENHPADIYYGNCIWVDEKKQLEYVSKPKSHDLSRLLYYMILIHPSTFVKKEVYDSVGVFNVSYRYCMDKELLYRFYKQNKKFYYLDQCLTKFKAGGVSDTHAKAVFKEGSRMALENGEPWIKVKAIEYKKLVREYCVRAVKSTPIYRMLKKR